MRRKIEITPDGQSYADIEPEFAPEGAPSEYADSVGTMDSHTASTAGAQAEVPSAANVHATAAGVSGAEATMTALQAEVSDLRARAEEAEKRLLYAQAEFQNALRRREEQASNLQKYATSDFIKNMLPVLDNFERALKAAEQSRNYDALIGGVNGTLKQLHSALQKAGVAPIEAVGKEFDPAYHEAIGHTESADYAANTVAEEVQKGYVMHDRVLRPTLVKVSQG